MAARAAFAAGAVTGSVCSAAAVVVYYQRRTTSTTDSVTTTTKPSATTTKTAPANKQRSAETRDDKEVPLASVLPTNPCGRVRKTASFVAEFDPRSRNPRWVLEVLSNESVNGEASRKQSEFYEDPLVEERFRNHLADFRGSGYDRGHLAPAADHKGSQKAMNSTFNLSNISPQVGEGFNRDYWARFEKFVKDTTKIGKRVYVVTGPLFLPTYDAKSGQWRANHPYIGTPPQLVGVPTHFYKVVLVELDKSKKKGQDDFAVGAFVMPNAPIDPKTPLQRWVVPLDALETTSALKFFDGYCTAEQRNTLRIKEDALRRKGLPGPNSSQGQLATSGQKLMQDADARALRPSTSTNSNSTNSAMAKKKVTHLCDAVACQLPSERWYEQGPKKLASQTESKPHRALPPPSESKSTS